MNPELLAALGLGGIGAASGYFSPDQQAAYNQYAQTMQDIAGSYDPYVKVGEGAMKGYAGLGAMNVLFPTLPENRMALTYQMSPYQQQMQQNVTDQMNANAATTGMLGSTAQDAALQNALAAQQNQWMQQYIDRGMGQYNRGINDMWNLTGLGFQGLGAQDRLLQEAALGTLRGQLAPTRTESAIQGALGGAASVL